MGSSQPWLAAQGQLWTPTSVPFVSLGGCSVSPQMRLCTRTGRPLATLPQAGSPQHPLGVPPPSEEAPRRWCGWAPLRPAPLAALAAPSPPGSRSPSTNYTRERAIAHPHPHFFWFLLM